MSDVDEGSVISKKNSTPVEKRIVYSNSTPERSGERPNMIRLC